jgi:hypothetical protein
MTNYNAPYLTRILEDCAEDIKESYPNLSDYESLMIAVQIQRNVMIERAFVLVSDNSYPTALEKIVHSIQDITASLQ